MSTLCKKALNDGFTRFKMKVGVNVEDDTRRARLMRREIGPNNVLMMDANQVSHLPCTPLQESLTCSLALWHL